MAANWDLTRACEQLFVLVQTRNYSCSIALLCFSSNFSYEYAKDKNCEKCMKYGYCEKCMKYGYMVFWTKFKTFSIFAKTAAIKGEFGVVKSKSVVKVELTQFPEALEGIFTQNLDQI